MSEKKSNNTHKESETFQRIEKLEDADFEILGEEVQEFDLTFKLIILGNSGVGKSCITFKAIKKQFSEEHQVTLGFEFFSFYVRINNKHIQLQIWDTCGMELYKSLISSFYKDSSLALLVYSVNDKQSFEDISKWLTDVKMQSQPDIKTILIGNKTDLEHERTVSTEEGQTFQNENQLDLFVETSAKSGNNVERTFLEAARILYNNYVDVLSMSRRSSMDSTIRSENFKLPKPKTQNKKKGCCG